MTSNGRPERIAVNLAEAAEMIGVHPHTIRALVKSGDLPASRIGRRYIIEIEQLERFLRLSRG